MKLAFLMGRRGRSRMVLPLLAIIASPATAGERIGFDAGWRFQRGDVEWAEQPSFGNSGWTTGDARGGLVPDAAVPVTVAIDGGTLAAFDNGSNTDQMAFASPGRPTYQGQALAMARAGDGRTVRVTATAPGLRSATASVAVHD